MHRVDVKPQSLGRAGLALLALLLPCLGLALAACPKETGPGGSDPSQMAVAEYDLARDAFKRGRSREALGHVQKALELDEANAEAAYFGAAIYLGFCALDEKSPDCRYALTILKEPIRSG